MRPDFDHIHVDMLIEDSKFYTQPFHYTRDGQLGKPDEDRYTRAARTTWTASICSRAPVRSVLTARAAIEPGVAAGRFR
jgi:hypothetical protein